MSLERSDAGFSSSSLFDRDGKLGDQASITQGSTSLLSGSFGFGEAGAGGSEESEPPLPSAPEPALGGGNPQREAVPWSAEWHTEPFSRIGIGADVSPLGIGIKGAIILDEYLDARVDMNFFSYTQGRIEIDGVNVTGNLHLLSSSAKLDVYPRNSIWRLTGGLMMFDGNRATASLNVVPGTSFKLNGTTYYSSSADPMTANGLSNLDTAKPSPLVSFGFGRFIPRSNRHWSFPTEFGVIYTGAPSLEVTTGGAVCTDAKLINCSEVSDTSTAVGQAFNTNLQAQLTKWRKDFDKVKLYPIFSYSVVYSFNIR